MKIPDTILDLCSGSGAWSRPYRLAGYNVIEVEIEKGRDVRLFEKIATPVKGILASPPCTHLAVSGARWWDKKGQGALFDALALVDACLRIVVVHNPQWWVLENPVGRLSRYLGKPRYIFDPNDYAEYSEDPISNEYTKKTCLWGNFNIPETRAGKLRNKDYIHKMPPSPDRGKKRSVTPDGFASAFQLANYTLDNFALAFMEANP